MRACLFLLVPLVAVGCVYRPAPRGHNDIGPKTAMAKAKLLLEKQDYAKFAEQFVPPADLAREEKAGKTRDAIGRERSEDLLARIHKVKMLRPVFSDQGHRAVYETTAGGKTTRVVLVMIDTRWYFA